MEPKRYWKPALAALVFVGLLSIVAAKEAGRSRARPPSPPPAEELLRAQLAEFYMHRRPSVVVLSMQPSYYCCDGTRIMYEDMRASTEQLVELLDGVAPSVFVDVNAIEVVDRAALRELIDRYAIKDLNSAVVVDAEGELVQTFYAPYLPQQVVDFLKRIGL